MDAGGLKCLPCIAKQQTCVHLDPTKAAKEQLKEREKWPSSREEVEARLAKTSMIVNRSEPDCELLNVERRSLTASPPPTSPYFSPSPSSHNASLIFQPFATTAPYNPSQTSWESDSTIASTSTPDIVYATTATSYLLPAHHTRIPTRRRCWCGYGSRRGRGYP